MELKSFIKTAIHEIMDAVEETIRERESKAGSINPKVHNADEMEIDTIKFDVAVTVGSRSQGSGEAGLRVLGVKVSGGGEHTRETSNVSRIEFTLGVSWPHSQILDAKKLVRAR